MSVILKNTGSVPVMFRTNVFYLYCNMRVFLHWRVFLLGWEMVLEVSFYEMDYGLRIPKVPPAQMHCAVIYGQRTISAVSSSVGFSACCTVQQSFYD